MKPSAVPIICAESQRPNVPAFRQIVHGWNQKPVFEEWRCSWCGARVKVVA